MYVFIYKYIKKDKYVQVEWVFFFLYIHVVVMLMFVRNAEYKVNHQDH